MSYYNQTIKQLIELNKIRDQIKHRDQLREIVDDSKRRLRAELRETNNDALQDRVRMQRNMAKYADNRRAYIYVWQRDCDMCEWDYVREMPAIPYAVEAYIDSVYDGAEGPVWAYLMTEDDAEEFTPSHRDRVMEAFENGRGNAHYV